MTIAVGRISTQLAQLHTLLSSDPHFATSTFVESSTGYNSFLLAVVDFRFDTNDRVKL